MTTSFIKVALVYLDTYCMSEGSTLQKTSLIRRNFYLLEIKMIHGLLSLAFCASHVGHAARGVGHAARGVRHAGRLAGHSTRLASNVGRHSTHAARHSARCASQTARHSTRCAGHTARHTTRASRHTTRCAGHTPRHTTQASRHTTRCRSQAPSRCQPQSRCHSGSSQGPRAHHSGGAGRYLGGNAGQSSAADGVGLAGDMGKEITKELIKEVFKELGKKSANKSNGQKIQTLSSGTLPPRRRRPWQRRSREGYSYNVFVQTADDSFQQYSEPRFRAMAAVSAMST